MYVAMAATFLTACGGIDAKIVSDDYCKCMDKAGEEKTSCVDAWVTKYKGNRITGDGEAMGASMAECNEENYGLAAVDDLLRLAD